MLTSSRTLLHQTDGLIKQLSRRDTNYSTNMVKWLEVNEMLRLVEAIKMLPGLSDFAVLESTITLKRWRDFSSLRFETSVIESTNRITSVLAPMQLKVKKMLGWLMNKTESGNLYEHCVKLGLSAEDMKIRLKAFIDDYQAVKITARKKGKDMLSREKKVSPLWQRDESRRDNRVRRAPQIDLDSDEERLEVKHSAENPPSSQ